MSLCGAALDQPSKPSTAATPLWFQEERGPPFPCCVLFLTSQSHASHQTVARDHSDVLRVLLTFELWGTDAGMVKMSQPGPHQSWLMLLLRALTHVPRGFYYL